jgi:hypothetical protein
MGFAWVEVVPNLKEVWFLLTKAKGCGTVYLCRCGQCMAILTALQPEAVGDLENAGRPSA